MGLSYPEFFTIKYQSIRLFSVSYRTVRQLISKQEVSSLGHEEMAWFV